MRTLVAIPCASEPSSEHLSGVMFTAGATELLLSLPAEVPTPSLGGIIIHRITHINVPWNIQNIARCIQYQNTISAPLAAAAADFVEEGDVVLYLHDNVPGQSAFEKIIHKANLYPHLAFVSVVPRLRSYQPEYIDYADRCVAWQKGALAHYGTMQMPNSIEDGTSLQYLMSVMDGDGGVPYLWTKINCIENFPPPPPTP